MSAKHLELDPESLAPEDLVYDERGLLPVVVQDASTGAVLMVAWADSEAVKLTLETGYAHFWSRSRQKLWKKGETSGNVLEVLEVLPDCDRDTLLVRARPAGPACHRGTRTCFEPNAAALELGWLAAVIAERRGAPAEESYTARLLEKGVAKIAQKVGEEATETVIAALTGEGGRDGGKSALASEAADLLYHLLVLFEATGTDPREIARELDRRHTTHRHQEDDR